jgi:glycosyltransferase involved in cell wall biosynthesis
MSQSNSMVFGTEDADVSVAARPRFLLAEGPVFIAATAVISLCPRRLSTLIASAILCCGLSPRNVSVPIQGVSPTLPNILPSQIARSFGAEIWVSGFPSAYGGADTELDHLIDLWRAYRVDVHLVPNHAPDANHLSDVMARGCLVHAYHPGIFADRVVVSFCNGEFLERLPAIVAAGRPACVVWANCMTWNFPREIEAHQAGLIDVFVFQSEYQRSMIAPALEAIRPIRDLTDYRPFFNTHNAMQRLKFSYREPAKDGYFGLGRVSRDDANKYPPDMWKIFAQVVSPLPTKTFILGFGPNAIERCGSRPPCEWLDWMTWSPSAIEPADLYRRIHVLIHKTGGSRENWPRTVLESMATGVAVIAEADWALPQMIENEVTGFLCRSSEEMSFRASQLAFDEPLRHQMVHVAYASFLQEHANPERSFAAWHTLLSEYRR